MIFDKFRPVFNNNFIKQIDCWYLKQYFSGQTSLFRYYQNIFIRHFGTDCQGKIIEIGADKHCGYRKYFYNAKEYIHTNISGDCDLILDVTNMSSISDNTVDTIVCISVLEHIFDYQQALAEIERVLKPGGKLLLTVPFGFPIHDKIDYWRFSRDFYIKKLNFFNIVSFIHFGGRLSTIANSLQRPCGKLTLKYFLFKSIGFLIAILAIRLDTRDSFPLGFGIVAQKKT